MDLDNNKPFIWRKKYEEQGIDIDERAIEDEIRRKAEENKVELAKIKERQRKRELEYQQKLNDGEFLQRQKESEQHEHWEQQEDDFVLRQHRHRSKIRIRDGRAKPIDLLAHYIDVFGETKSNIKNESGAYQEKIDLSDSPIELLNPCDWFDGLRQSDLEALEPDIIVYMNADCDENRHYWRDLLEITKDELSKLRALKEPSSSSDINSSVVNDIMSLFEGKTISELDDLEDEMSDILKNDDPSIDSAFYTKALSRLRAYRAKKRLTSNHKKNLSRQKDKILEKPDPKEEENPENHPKIEDLSVNDGGNVDDEEAEEDEMVSPQNWCITEYEKGSYSPKMYRKSQLDPGTVCVEFEREYEFLAHQRNQVRKASTLDEAKMVTMTSEERAFMSVASKGMDNQEESTFSCEATIKGSDDRALTYTWADKYQPRKPRYFNRVHTGFEWNKYNQTHYDVDNPPPKIVQGYKFNIFYPDLIDKSKAPTFSLTPCKEDKDFCTIRFSAGPPYEDIAFRIVNREWNNSHKSGYRCQFMNNILQLWFQFKRRRYRR